jgi:hypothetical protein
MSRPRRLDALTKPLSARIRNEQDWWLRHIAGEKFEGEIGQAVRWALDQAQVFDFLMHEKDPVAALDEMLNPPPDPVHPEEAVVEAEREFEMWKREQAVKRAQRRTKDEA